MPKAKYSRYKKCLDCDNQVRLESTRCLQCSAKASAKKAASIRHQKEAGMRQKDARERYSKTFTAKMRPESLEQPDPTALSYCPNGKPHWVKLELRKADGTTPGRCKRCKQKVITPAEPNMGEFKPVEGGKSYAWEAPSAQFWAEKLIYEKEARE